jgi:uroporphyrinogen-III synthase
MTLPIFVIRPEPGCTATVDRGRRAGLALEACPLFEVQSLAWDEPSPDRYDGLLLGSANAVRHSGPGLDPFRGKRAFLVGRATAAAAEAAGLTVAAVGQGGLQSLLPALRPPLTLLRLAGQEHVPLRPPLGVVIDTRIVYRSAAQPMPEAMAAKLRGGGLVLLHSAAAARHFAGECDRLGIARAAVVLAALGPRIADAAGGGWRALRSAEAPRDAALLALARDLCHEPPPG